MLLTNARQILSDEADGGAIECGSQMPSRREQDHVYYKVIGSCLHFRDHAAEEC